MISDDPLKFVIAHIGEGHIVSLKKTEPGIIVLEIQGFPHPRRHLVNKAENTLVAAGTVSIH